MGKKENMSVGAKKQRRAHLFRTKKHVRVYADAAAAAPLDAAVSKRLVALLALYGNPGGLHAEALAASQELDRARREIADTLHAHSDEIIFTASGTEANNLALLGAIRKFLEKENSAHLITLSLEHPSISEPLALLEKEGCVVTRLPVDTGGLLSPRTLKDAITENTVLISIQMVNSEIGTVQDIPALAREVRRARKERAAKGNTRPLYFHSDAAQAPLYELLSVDALGVDLLSLDAQKIMGPKGVGALFCRRGVELSPVILGGSQEKGRRAGTENAPLAGALAEALMRAQKNTEKRSHAVASLRDLLLKEVSRIAPDVVVNGTMTSRSPNNLNISIPGLEGEVAVIALDSFGVAASTRSACSTGDTQMSPALHALGASPARAREAIRLTLLPSATRADVRRIGDALRQVCDLYRQPHA